MLGDFVVDEDLDAPLFQEGADPIDGLGLVEERIGNEHAAGFVLTGEFAREEWQSEKGVGSDPDARTYDKAEIGHALSSPD
jgi:hypothetical protein